MFYSSTPFGHTFSAFLLWLIQQRPSPRFLRDRITTKTLPHFLKGQDHNKDPPTFFKGTGSCERSHAASIVAGGLATGIYTTNSTDAVRSVLRHGITERRFWSRFLGINLSFLRLEFLSVFVYPHFSIIKKFMNRLDTRVFQFRGFFL